MVQKSIKREQGLSDVMSNPVTINTPEYLTQDTLPLSDPAESSNTGHVDEGYHTNIDSITAQRKGMSKPHGNTESCLMFFFGSLQPRSAVDLSKFVEYSIRKLRHRGRDSWSWCQRTCPSCPELTSSRSRRPRSASPEDCRCR